MTTCGIQCPTSPASSDMNKAVRAGVLSFPNRCYMHQSHPHSEEKWSICTFTQELVHVKAISSATRSHSCCKHEQYHTYTLIQLFKDYQSMGFTGITITNCADIPASYHDQPYSLQVYYCKNTCACCLPQA